MPRIPATGAVPSSLAVVLLVLVGNGGSLAHADPYNARRPAAWTALTAAALAVGGGYYFFQKGRREGRAFDDPARGCSATAPDKGGMACAALDLEAQRGHDLGIGGFVAGGVLTAVAMYLFATDKEPGADRTVSLLVSDKALALHWGTRF